VRRIFFTFGDLVRNAGGSGEVEVESRAVCRCGLVQKSGFCLEFVHSVPFKKRLIAMVSGTRYTGISQRPQKPSVSYFAFPSTSRKALSNVPNSSNPPTSSTMPQLFSTPSIASFSFGP
jgi:hypothetical protein